MAIDSLLGHGQEGAVLGITENLLRKRPDHWEALYREGQALAGLSRQSEAEARFRAILQLKGNDDEVGSVARARKRMAQPVGRPQRPAASTRRTITPPPSRSRSRTGSGRLYNVRGASGIDGRYSSGSAWSPDDLGQARMAAVGWLVHPGDQGGHARRVPGRPSAKPPRRPLMIPEAHWDLYYLQLLRLGVRRHLRGRQRPRQGRAD